MVRAADFPELKLLVWNRPEGVELDEQEALALYEANWRFVDQALLTAPEQALIERLKNEYGRGVLHV
jgi:hypothetical protein